MKRYVSTSAPGSGKISIIKALEMKGYSVVSEAATYEGKLHILLGGVEETCL